MMILYNLKKKSNFPCEEAWIMAVFDYKVLDAYVRQLSFVTRATAFVVLCVVRDDALVPVTHRRTDAQVSEDPLRPRASDPKRNTRLFGSGL